MSQKTQIYVLIFTFQKSKLTRGSYRTAVLWEGGNQILYVNKNFLRSFPPPPLFDVSISRHTKCYRYYFCTACASYDSTKIFLCQYSTWKFKKEFTKVSVNSFIIFHRRDTAKPYLYHIGARADNKKGEKKTREKLIRKEVSKVRIIKYFFNILIERTDYIQLKIKIRKK